MMASPLLSIQAANLESGVRLTLDAYHAKQNNVLTGTFHFESFCGIRIGHGTGDAYSSAWVEIYPNRLEVYSNTFEPFQTGAWHHGLEIDAFLDVVISVRQNNKAIIRIGTAGGFFESPEVDFRGCGTQCFAEAIHAPLTDVVLSYVDNDKRKDIWLFGDSYMDMYPKYLIASGFGRFALDGHSGRNTQAALRSLQHALEHFSPPKLLLWAMGMNDADEENVINPNWLEATREMLAICEKHRITPVLCTVPDTPTRLNRQKNQYMHCSGYRVCDIASSVQQNGKREWFPGTLRTDQVHPTEKGSRLIAVKVMAEVPELQDY